MKLLDTNIIIYAAGRAHRYKEACTGILAEVASGSTEYAIDVELLQEVLYVYASRGERTRGIYRFDDLLSMFPNPIPIGLAEVLAAHQLMGRFPGLFPRDAIHAAVVQTQGLEGIVTTDKAFDDISGIIVIDPLALSSKN